MSRQLREARIIARNRANEVANQLYGQVVEVFRERIGQQVCKADGTFLKKVMDLLPNWDFPDKFPNPTVMVYRYSSDYSVCFVAKTCQQVEDTHGCVYEECSVYICDLTNGGKVVADKIYDPPNNRTDYTVEELEEKRRVFEEKKREFDKARSDLHPFGENDR